MVSLRLELIMYIHQLIHLKDKSLIQNLGISGINSFIFLTVPWYLLIALRKSYLRKAHFFRNWGKSSIPQQFILNSALTTGKIVKDPFFL